MTRLIPRSDENVTLTRYPDADCSVTDDDTIRTGSAFVTTSSDLSGAAQSLQTLHGGSHHVLGVVGAQALGSDVGDAGSLNNCLACLCPFSPLSETLYRKCRVFASAIRAAQNSPDPLGGKASELLCIKIS